MGGASPCDLFKSKDRSTSDPFRDIPPIPLRLSGQHGFNQAIRDKGFNPNKEFIPVSLRERDGLRKAKQTKPIIWLWDEGRIKRLEPELLSLHLHKIMPQRLKTNK